MRDYEESHPWITFKAADERPLPSRTWMLLGEALAICEQIASTPMGPSIAQDLEELALIKGAHATTAIEGNTLNEEQVGGIYRGEYKAPLRGHTRNERCVTFLTFSTTLTCT